MKQPDAVGAIDYARRRMEQELAPKLAYHSAAHTFDNVLPAAMELATHCQLDEIDTLLVAVAAAYHDIGWVITGNGHESASVDIAREVLPDFGFSSGQIERIAGMIMATKLPQSPSDLLEEIVVDADLDVLGRDDFWARSIDLRNELAANGDPRSDEQWISSQLEFLETHRYFTKAAQELRGERKRENVADMKRRLSLARKEKSNSKSGA